MTLYESGLAEDLFAHTMQHAQEVSAQRITRVLVIIRARATARPVCEIHEYRQQLRRARGRGAAG